MFRTIACLCSPHEEAETAHHLFHLGDAIEDVVQLRWNVSRIGVVFRVIVMLVTLEKDGEYMLVKARMIERKLNTSLWYLAQRALWCGIR